ncbi:D-2-hydroxyacid dehydrogenase [Paludisphaera mucosa]|uniref:D-2-hydroxyacid dehydrogenase n=1 Tax=Paludisphaera mucosa TaxID=3030827 RepID=A0ABT6FH75_9BACT|nr:D-2-hydroxyacid dehydrogenase [Paludisphaera mucosa]MDG3006915.1 D-2-hydroxyacid dehydrogenase [Paludisphaera mucosa]
MNRRSFLAAASATTAVLAATEAPAAARAEGRLKVIVPKLRPEEMSDLQAAAPGLDLIVCGGEDEAVARVAEAQGLCYIVTPRVLRAGAKSLQWAQNPSAGVEHLMGIPELVEGPIVLTNMQRAFAPEIADQALAYLLAFTRDIPHFLRDNAEKRWGDRRRGVVLEELAGKTMVVVGLGGIGTEIARRAYGFGVRVVATDPKVWERPLFVDELHKPEKLHDLLPTADVVASAVPLTKASTKLIGAKEFGLMKQGAILINVSRGKVVDTDALVAALDSGKVAAAGLDVTDPEPLPDGHPLWSRNVIITPHTAGQSPGGERRRHEILRENLRRFAAGETLLNVVDKKAGY